MFAVLASIAGPLPVQHLGAILQLVGYVVEVELVSIHLYLAIARPVAACRYAIGEIDRGMGPFQLARYALLDGETLWRLLRDAHQSTPQQV